MAELTVSDEIVELKDNRISLNKQAYSTNDWLTKFITVSERLRLPETNTTNKIFKNALRLDVNANKFNRYFPYKYTDYGKVITDGNCYLLGFSENKEYEIQLQDKSKKFFDTLKEKNINELTNLDSYDFVFNSTSYSNLKLLTSSIWLWGTANMHEKPVISNNILSTNISFSRPFFSVRRLLEKMFDESKWTYELGNNIDIFDKLVVSCNLSKFVFTSYDKLFNFGQAVSGTYNMVLSTPDFLKTDTVTGANVLNLNYTSNIRIRGQITAGNDCELIISGTSNTGTDTQTESFPISQGTYFYDLTSKEFETADLPYKINIDIVGISNVTFTNVYIYTIIDENDFGTMSSANFTNFKVKTYDNMPDLNQLDLYKHSLTTVAGFFNTDNYRKKIEIDSLINISKLGSLDWSDKLNEDSVKISTVQKLGKQNIYSYDNDDTKPENLGRGIFTIDNDIYKDSNEIYKSIFAASNEVIINSNTMIDLKVYDNTERINDLNTIICYYEDQTTYYNLRFDKLNGNNVINSYYKKFVNSLKKGIIVEALFNLNRTDFFSFDFKKTVYIEKFNSYFWVLRIENYVEGEETTVYLLQYN